MNNLQFQNAADIGSELASRWFLPVIAAMTEFDINLPEEQAMFISQVGHESGSFTRIVESLNYSIEGLNAMFSKYFPGDAAMRYGRSSTQPADQKAIANIVYGHRMGNSGGNDGWNYRGRGLIQITGYDNYHDCGDSLGIDLIAMPGLLEQDEYAARSAAWFFTSRGCKKHCDDIVAVTKIINGGLNGLDDRKERYRIAAVALAL